jgi:hypothetical protein
MKWLLTVSLVLLESCSSGGDGTKKGDLGAPCYENKTCNGDLSCTCAAVDCNPGVCVDVGIANPRANAACNSSTECGGALCVSKSLSGSPKVCALGAAMCEARGLSGACLLEVVSVCQYAMDCDPSSTYPDFNTCIAKMCRFFNNTLTDAECTDQLNNGAKTCP